MTAQGRPKHEALLGFPKSKAHFMERVSITTPQLQEQGYPRENTKGKEKKVVRAPPTDIPMNVMVKYLK